MRTLPLLVDEDVRYRARAALRLSGRPGTPEPAILDRHLPLLGVGHHGALGGVLYVTGFRLLFVTDRVSPVRGSLSVPLSLVRQMERVHGRWRRPAVEASASWVRLHVRTREASAVADAVDEALLDLAAWPDGGRAWRAEALERLGDWRLGQGLDRVGEAAVRLHDLRTDAGPLDRLSAVLADRLRPRT